MALGGNILQESGLGSLTAGQSVVFSHRRFTGTVIFLVTKPRAMTLMIGYAQRNGSTYCEKYQSGVSSQSIVECDENTTPEGFSFKNALLSACSLNRAGVCSAESAAVAAAAGEEEDDLLDVEPLVDFDELLATLEERKDEIDRIRNTVRDKVLERRLSEVVDFLKDLDNQNGNAAKVASGVDGQVWTELKELLRDTLPEQIEDIRAIAREETGYRDHLANFDRLEYLTESLTELRINVRQRVDDRTKLLGQNQKDMCDNHVGCTIRNLFE